MARDKPKIEAGAAAAQGGVKQTAIAFAVAGLIAAGVGAGYATLAKPDPEAHHESAARPPGGSVAASIGKPEEKRKFAPVLEMGTLDLSPVVTNLAAPADVWVRVEGSLLFEGKTLPHGDALAGQIAGDILAFMRTQTLAQIQGVAGLQHLRQDLNERVVTRSQGKVREFVIKSLVVQ